jgi:invasion protein IalB
MTMRLASMLAGLALAAAVAVPAGPAAAQDEDNAWVKICNADPDAQKEVCLITQELRTDSGQFLASVAIRETPGEQRRSILVSVPVGMLIQAGVQLQVDGAEPTRAQYTICFPNACYAELAVDGAYINKLKAGGKLQLTTMNQQARPVRFDLTLIGFTAAYESEGLAPQALQARQEELQRELEQRAQEARDRLVAAQRRAVEESGE